MEIIIGLVMKLSCLFKHDWTPWEGFACAAWEMERRWCRKCGRYEQTVPSKERP